MSKIRIAILDSKCIVFPKYNEIEIKLSNKECQNLHGSMTIQLLDRLVQNNKFFVYEIMTSNGSTSMKILYETLIKLLEEKIDIIHMSLSIRNESLHEQVYLREIMDICSCLKNQGKVIVCSTQNRQYCSYPAALDTVIGVRGSILKQNHLYGYCNKKKIQMITNYNPILCKINENKMFFGGNSQAATIATSIIINFLKNKGKDIDLEKCLYENASFKIWEDKMVLFDNINKTMGLEKNFIEPSIEKYIKENYKLQEIYNKDGIANKKYEKIYFGIIEWLEKKYQLEYNNIYFFDFNNIYTISQAFAERWVNLK